MSSSHWKFDVMVRIHAIEPRMDANRDKAGESSVSIRGFPLHGYGLFRQRYAAGGGIWQVEKGGVAHGADTCALASLGDHDAKSGLFVAIRPEEAQFHQFVCAQMPLQFAEECWREPAFADFERRLQSLAESAQERLLRAGESG
jgi:hypothetical protein